MHESWWKQAPRCGRGAWKSFPLVVERVLTDRGLRERMLGGARRLAHPHAAVEAAEMIAGLVRTPKEVVA